MNKKYVVFVEHEKSEAAKRIEIEAGNLSQAIDEALYYYGKIAKSVIAIEVNK